MSWVSGWRLAVGTLTVLPVRPPASLDAPVPGRAMLLASLAELPVAVAAAAAGWLVGSVGPALLAGLTVVLITTVGTRALHLDGLADTVDGLGSGQDRERALAIMRRGDIGPMGVLALILVLGIQAVAAGVLVGEPRGALLLVVALAASRAALLVGCRRGVPAARADGLGAAVAGCVPVPVATAAGAASALAVVAAGLVAGRPWWALLIGLVAALTAAVAVVRVAVRRFGGITGDVLGAAVELSSTALLLGVALG